MIATAIASPLFSALRLAFFNVGLGFARKLPSILSRSLALSLDVVALQEIGDPALHSNKLSHYSLVYSGGPSQQQAGVGLLLSHDIAPLCRTYRRSLTGRLVGAVLEVDRGHQLLIVSAYMPSGLDHRSPADASTLEAHALYGEIIDWTRGMQQVVVMGDLNETLTPHDRFPVAAPRRAAAATPSPMQCLLREGFVDAYRISHPNPEHQPGFTHTIHSALRNVRSRIDYIWTRGCTAASVLQTHIDSALHRQRLSAHHLLWMELQLNTVLPLPTSTPLFHSRLPNVRAVSSQHRTAFAASINQDVMMKEQLTDLTALAARDDSLSLSSFAQQLTNIAHDAAFSALPLIGAAQYRSKSILRLQAKQRDLTRLLQLSEQLAADGITFQHCPAWVQRHKHCLAQHDVIWSVDVHYRTDPSHWLGETRRLICSTRADVRRAKQQLDRVKKPQLDASPAATVHRMLESDAFPSQLFSVISSCGELTNGPDELKNVMADHFEAVFALPPAAALPLVPAPPLSLFSKPGMDPSWYNGLMAEVDSDELMSLFGRTPSVSAPGEDQVSTAVWKLALEESDIVRRYVLKLFNTCLRTSIFRS